MHAGWSVLVLIAAPGASGTPAPRTMVASGPAGPTASPAKAASIDRDDRRRIEDAPGVALATTAGGADCPAPVSSELLAATRAFSDATQAGDGRRMSSLLDEHVVFFNEDGERSTRDEMVAATPAATAGVATQVTVTDWGCVLDGDVAVASFIDDLRQDFHGQPFHARFRSVETWRRAAGGWLMTSSSTIELRDDPRSVDLSAVAMDAYAGAYEAAPGVRFEFRRRGGRLEASSAGGPWTPQLVEAPDVVFTPGRSRYTKVFERDGEGRVVGFFLRREGHDIHFRRVG